MNTVNRFRRLSYSPEAGFDFTPALARVTVERAMGDRVNGGQIIEDNRGERSTD